MTRGKKDKQSYSSLGECYIPNLLDMHAVGLHDERFFIVRLLLSGLSGHGK